VPEWRCVWCLKKICLHKEEIEIDTSLPHIQKDRFKRQVKEGSSDTGKAQNDHPIRSWLTAFVYDLCAFLFEELLG
jgi:hypothetical protein